ncbi:MAG: acetyl-CoA carboxylase carboxyl transferase subunit beta, partial [Rhodospirillales bacterium]
MNWLKNFVRPKLQQLIGNRETPDNLWHKCPECQQMIFHRDLEKNIHVCQHCGHHMRLSARRRLEMLFDEGEYQSVEIPATPDDPLNFRDQRKYTERLKDARNMSDGEDALIVAHGKLGGTGVVVAALDFSFMG